MSLKERRKALMIFLSISLAIVGIILAVVMFGGNKASALGSQCPNCKQYYVNDCVCGYCGHEVHSYSNCVCTSCGATNHTSTSSWSADGANGHYKYCTKCYKTLTSNTHSYTTTTTEPTCTSAGSKNYSCGACGYSYSESYGSATGHNYIGGTCETKSTCSNCGASGSYGSHSYSSATCTRAKTCRYCGGTSGSALGHTGATHDNGGVCTRCSKKVEEHSQSTTVKEYDTTETTHTPTYECTFSGCLSTYDGAEEPHSGGTHDNGGICEDCGEQYQNHGQDTQNPTYTPTENGHKPVYPCTETNCPETYDGAEEPHTVTGWTDNGDGTHSGECDKCGEEVVEDCEYEGGECPDCGADEPIQGCEHRYSMAYDSTNHWEKCSICNQIKENSRQAHNVTSWSDNGDGTHSGTCTVCGYKVTKEHNYTDDTCDDCGSIKGCEHNYIMKNDPDNHWKECNKCNEVKSNSKEKHKITEYKTNGNGTHSGTCTVCGYTITKTHNYDDNGKCPDCGALEKNETKCEHTYEMKYNEKNHWEECTKCKTTKENTIGKHNITTWKDNGNGTHTGKCTVCTYSLTEKHTDGTSNNCGKCEYGGSSSSGIDDTQANG